VVRGDGGLAVHTEQCRREARKLDTQAMYESWQKEYRDLKKRRRICPTYGTRNSRQQVSPTAKLRDHPKHMRNKKLGGIFPPNFNSREDRTDQSSSNRVGFD